MSTNKPLPRTQTIGSRYIATPSFFKWYTTFVKKQIKELIASLPPKPGVYIFKNNREEILYIGKAKNIKKRVRGHFTKNDSSQQHVPYSRIAQIDFIPTRSEANALVLERQLVQRHQPKYNVELKDDKNFFFVAFSNDTLPKIFLTHQPQKYSDTIGPFVYGKELKTYFKHLRVLFPYRTCRNKAENPCLYFHLGLCAAHGKQAESYPQIIEGLKTFLRLYAQKKTRIEAYDISNTQGSLSVGSMVSFKNARPDTSSYRKFKIRTVSGSNDVLSLREIITRRLAHTEWTYPDLIVLDGGKSQLSGFKNFALPVVALAKLGNARFSLSSLKRSTSRSQTKGVLWTPYGISSLSLDVLPAHVKKALLLLRDEAHRFAIGYHRKRRIKDIQK